MYEDKYEDGETAFRRKMQKYSIVSIKGNGKARERREKRLSYEVVMRYVVKTWWNVGEMRSTSDSVSRKEQKILVQYYISLTELNLHFSSLCCTVLYSTLLYLQYSAIERSNVYSPFLLSICAIVVILAVYILSNSTSTSLVYHYIVHHQSDSIQA